MSILEPIYWYIVFRGKYKLQHPELSEIEIAQMIAKRIKYMTNHLEVTDLTKLENIACLEKINSETLARVKSSKERQNINDQVTEQRENR